MKTTEKNDNSGCFSGVAIKRRKYPVQGPPTKTYAAARLLRRGNHRHGRCLRHDRAANVLRIQADHLSRLRRLKSHLARQRIDPARIAERSRFQLEAASLRDPGRIDALARQMGLESPQPGQVIRLNPEDVGAPIIAQASPVAVIAAAP